jgi:hypothetical protein
MNLATYPSQISSMSYSLWNAYVGFYLVDLNFCFELEINNI